MKTRYPYMTKTKSIKSFFEKVSQINVPDKVTQRLLPSLNFKSSSDRPLIPLLRTLKFIDGEGRPTERYRKYRDKSESTKIMANAVREVYSELFKLYSDADKKDSQTLQNFFSTHTSLGERGVKATVETFKVLCSISDFDNLGEDKDMEETYSEVQREINRINVLNISLGDNRFAKIIFPEDIKENEIEKLKRLLDASK